MTQKLFASCILTFLMTCNLGCLGSSGGNGNTTSGNNEPTPRSNPSPLQIVSAKIRTMNGLEDLSESVAIQDIDIQANLVEIVLEFNKGVGSLIRNSMNATADDIYLSSMSASGEQGSSLNIDINGKSISLSPKLDLRPQTSYKLILKSDITATDGASMNSDKSYKFKTKDTEPSEIDQWVVFKWLPAGRDTESNPITEDGFGFHAEEVPSGVLPENVGVRYLLKDVLMQEAISNPDSLQLEPGWLGRRIHYRDFNLGTEENPIYMEFGKPYVFRLTAFLWRDAQQASKNESRLSDSFKVIEL